jgi:hypothetical protein
VEYYYYYYLIKFNVRIEPLGYGRLIIHGFTSLGASSRSTFVLALHGRQSPGFRDTAGCSTVAQVPPCLERYIHSLNRVDKRFGSLPFLLI